MSVNDKVMGTIWQHVLAVQQPSSDQCRT